MIDLSYLCLGQQYKAFDPVPIVIDRLTVHIRAIIKLLELFLLQNPSEGSRGRRDVARSLPWCRQPRGRDVWLKYLDLTHCSLGAQGVEQKMNVAIRLRLREPLEIGQD